MVAVETRKLTPLNVINYVIKIVALSQFEMRKIQKVVGGYVDKNRPPWICVMNLICPSGLKGKKRRNFRDSTVY